MKTRDLAAQAATTRLVPVHLRGAFHPKLIVALGKSKGALFVGSHNTTLAGFGLNDEITNEFRTSGAGRPPGSRGDSRRSRLPADIRCQSASADLGQVFGAVKTEHPMARRSSGRGVERADPPDDYR